MQFLRFSLALVTLSLFTLCAGCASQHTPSAAIPAGTNVLHPSGLKAIPPGPGVPHPTATRHSAGVP